MSVKRTKAAMHPTPRCEPDEWYLVRARLADTARLTRAASLVTFLKRGAILGQRCLDLHAIEVAAGGTDLLGWFKTPKGTTHVQVCIPDAGAAEQAVDVALRHVSELDPKCHPLANVPRWGTYRPPFAIQRVVLPDRLTALAERLDGLEVKTLRRPKSLTELRRAARGAACVVDPEWVRDLGLTLADLERLAAGSWLLVDLGTLASLLSAAGAADAQLVTHAARDGLMSARVEYADVPTRGLALQDVVPYTTFDPRGRFCLRGIRADRSWKRHADEVGFATLLSGETPWAQKHGDVLSAMRAVGGGELIATDLPWLVAGEHGPLLAPHLATHLLRMHVTAPLADHLQYWTRWEDANTIVRDIADLPRRYTPLWAVSWPSLDSARARLGITLLGLADGAVRHVVFQTGRMDKLDIHDGLPPEPMTIFMKWLAREAREQTTWARQYLAGTRVTWQFDTAAGLKYAANYGAASGLDALVSPPEVIRIRMDPAGQTPSIVLPDDEGLHGDHSLLFQDALTRRLCRVIEERAMAGPALHGEP
jgi:hypothetical protein